MFGLLAVVAVVVSVLTGAAVPLPGVRFVLTGHWVYDAAAQDAFHIDGATANVDAQAPVPADPGSQVVMGGSSGFVIGHNRITRFGQSSLSVEQTTTPPSPETPVGIEAVGGPYLVYRKAGKVVRLGDPAATISLGGPVGVPVVTGDGTLWLFRTGSGLVCELPEGANHISACPAMVPGGHAGALTLVSDKPEFVDTTAGQIRPVGTSGLGDPVPIGVPLSPAARPATNDTSGRVAVLDQSKNRMYLVDPHAPAAPPVTVRLPDTGTFEGPVASGSVVALIDRTDSTLLTFDRTGRQRSATPIPKQAGAPRLTRGADGRIYVDTFDGTDVLVVDPNGKVVNVPVGPPETSPTAGPTTTPNAPSTPAVPPSTHPTVPPVPTTHPTPPPVTRTPPPPVPATPPGAPLDVAATARPGGATVTWAAAADNRSTIKEYRVSWSGGSAGTTVVSGRARRATVTGLTDGARYTFTVVAVNAAGAGPAASSNPVTPAGAAGAPPGLTAHYANGQAVVRWHTPDLRGGQLLHYLVSATGAADQTVTGTSITYTGLTAGSTTTFTVRAVTRTTRGTISGTPSRISLTVPAPTVVVSRGAETSSSDCEAPACAWLDVTMTGFAPDTDYTVMPFAGDDGHNFSEPCEATTDANGDATCNDIRYDVPGQYVWVVVQTPDGQVESNHLYWTDG